MSYIEDFFIDIFGYYEDVMLLGVLVFIVLIIVVLFILLRKKEEYKKFKTLNLYGVVWRWNWMGKKKIISLWCYCPVCGSELMCDDEACRSSDLLANKTTYFICQKCGGIERSRIVGGDRKHVLKIVKFEINKKVSQNSYKDEAVNNNG